MLTRDHRTEHAMTPDTWRVRPGTTVRLKDYDSGDSGGFADHGGAEAACSADLAALRDLQERLYADDRHAILLVLQGMDTSGKDGTTKYLSGGISLLAGEVISFKQPTSTDLAHDFLWRIHQRAPARGKVGIFNRSHYEDV